jgi:hypothetical protein
MGKFQLAAGAQLLRRCSLLQQPAFIGGCSKPGISLIDRISEKQITAFLAQFGLGLG